MPLRYPSLNEHLLKVCQRALKVLENPDWRTEEDCLAYDEDVIKELKQELSAVIYQAEHGLE